MFYLLVALGGMAGSACRLLVSRAVQTLAADFPLGTLAVNWSGSFLVGLVAGAIPSGAGGGAASALLVSGFLGAYTTFSTLSYETVQLYAGGMRLPALANALLSAAVPVALVWLGWRLS